MCNFFRWLFQHKRWVHDADNRGLCQWTGKLCYGMGDFWCWGCKRYYCVNHVHDLVFEEGFRCDYCVGKVYERGLIQDLIDKARF